MTGQPAGSGPEAPAQIDWRAVERSPEFRELTHTRNRFVYPATAFFLAWYVGFVLLAGYAPDFMGESVYEGLTVGYVLALSQFVMVWGLTWLYIRRAERRFDPLADEARRVALEGRAADERQPSAPTSPTEAARPPPRADGPRPTTREVPR